MAGNRIWIVLYNRLLSNRDGNWPTSLIVYVKWLILKALLHWENLRIHRYFGHSMQLQMRAILNFIEYVGERTGRCPFPRKKKESLSALLNKSFEFAS